MLAYAIGIALLVASFGLTLFFRRRQERLREQEMLAHRASQEKLPPLQWSSAPAFDPPAAPAFTPSPAVAPGKVEFQLNIPDMRDAFPPTERQMALLKEWYSDQFDDLPLTQRQVSLLLDIGCYINGFWSHRTGTDPPREIRVILSSAILRDAKLWREIRNWGRGRFNSGRSTKYPDLNTSSPLYHAVSALTDEISRDPAEWFKRLSAHD